MTLNEAIRIYEGIAVTQAAHAWKSWCKAFEERWGHRCIGSITNGDVNEFVTERRKAGISDATIRSQLNTLRQLYHTANDNGFVCQYPSRVAKTKVNNERIRSLEGNEEMLLKRFLKPSDWEIVELGISTGLRGAELWSLKRKDVDLTEGFIRVIGKGGKHRRVPIGKTARRILKKMLLQRTEYLIVPEGFEGFKSRSSCMAAWKERRWRPALHAAGIKNLRFHDATRHEFATRVVRAGKSLYVLQRALGHSSPVMTQRYAHLADRDLKDCVAGI